jgi:translocation and assembly module TamA
VTLEFLTSSARSREASDRRSKSLPLTYSVTRARRQPAVQPTRGYVLNASSAARRAAGPDRRPRSCAPHARRAVPPAGEKASTLILRFETGALASSTKKAGVPSTFLFRAGGDQSVRGYGYQELGVQEGDATVGGRYLLTGSAEYQYWFKPPWGVAVFVDAGNAADKPAMN